MSKPSRSIYASRLAEFPDIALADGAATQHRSRWGEMFRERIGTGFGGRIIFEIGCFDAAFLTGIAAKHPDTAFVGLDWKCKAIYDGACRVREQKLQNVVLLRARAQDLSAIFATGELDEIWLLHPDPCDKPAELKNRLVSEAFLLDAHGALRDSSSAITLKTDHPGYFQWTLALLGLPQPDAFVTGIPSHRLAKARARDLMKVDDLPARSPAALERFTVTGFSSNFWEDPAALSHVNDRLFAGEATLFESRFVKKKQNIYFLEVTKR